jgi:penicillin V acylase-like amidase (Ntn superfamily)
MNLSDYNKTNPTNLIEAQQLIEWLMDRIDQLNEIIEELEEEKEEV